MAFTKTYPSENKKGPAHMSRRHFLGLTATGVAGMCGAGTYARFIEPEWLEVTEVNLPREKFSGAPAGLRILQMSDLHYSDVVPLSMLEEAFKTGVSLKPDLICLTGDFVTKGLPAEDPDGKKYAKLLSMLPAVAPTIACPGNHDYYGLPSRGMRALLASAGIRLLQNESVRVPVPRIGATIRITGLDDLWNGFLDPVACLEELSTGAKKYSRTKTSPEKEPHLLLCHNPDGKENVIDYSWDVMLAGHTHGGQVCLPFWGPLTVPVTDKRFVAGFYNWKNRVIYISRGVGNLHGIRFFCRPEITLLKT